ncbi:MAG: prepilin-type N-terminal cleavage/methylation domain-containing protein, partial [Bacteroidetes bacterium]|nr:prepilin-type N-terminal cleavage/methylation domain-containing protein [Bacteroidota bacterium]
MKRNSGFSLVELMIVIVIIGVLAAVAVPIYSNNVMKAKMSEADAALGSIRTQLRVYYGENGT